MGVQCSNHSSISKEASEHFKSLFNQPKIFNLLDQLRTIKKFPCMFNEENRARVDRAVSLLEVKSALDLFSKDKSPGPDG